MSNTRFGGRWLKLGVAAVMGGALLAPMASYASAEGNRNTAIALTALAAIILSSNSDRDHYRHDYDHRYYGGGNWGRGRDDRRNWSDNRRGHRDWNHNDHRGWDR